MHRRRALSLFATAIGVSVSSQAHAFADALKTVSGNLPNFGSDPEPIC